MLAGLITALRIADLRRRVLFTAVMLVLYRLGAHLPVPGVNVAALERLFRQQGSGFSFLDLFGGETPSPKIPNRLNAPPPNRSRKLNTLPSCRKHRSKPRPFHPGHGTSGPNPA